MTTLILPYNIGMYQSINITYYVPYITIKINDQTIQHKRKKGALANRPIHLLKQNLQQTIISDLIIQEGNKGGE